MLKVNPKHVKAVLDLVNHGPFFRHLSMRVTDMGIGYSVVVLSIGKKHMNPFGGIHGGVYASAIDTAAYWSGYCDVPEEDGLVTLDVKVDFLTPVSDAKVVIQGRRIKAGKTIYLTEGTMLDARGNIVAHGTSKLMVIRGKQSITDLVKYIGSTALPKKFLKN